MKKCQCNDTGQLLPGMSEMYDPVSELPYVAHKPGQCQCTNDLRQYKRDGRLVWLCSCCCLPGDTKV